MLTYFIYGFLFVFSIFCSCILSKEKHVFFIDGQGYKLLDSPQERSAKNLAFCSIFLVYIIIVGFRYKVGVDYTGYLNWYLTYCESSTFPVEGMDKGYLFLNFVSKSFGLPFTFIIIVLTLGVLIPLLKIPLYFKFLYPYFFFFFYTIIFNESMNVMRQISAFFLCLYAYTLYFRGLGIRKSIFVFFLGLLMHNTSLITLCWLPFLKFDFFKNRVFTGLLLVLSFGIGSIFYENIKEYFYILSSYSDSRFSEIDDWHMEHFENFTQEAATEGIAKYAYLVINLILIFYSKTLKVKFKNYKFIFFYQLYIIGSILEPVFTSNNTLFTRANYYFILHGIIVLSFFSYYLLNSKSWTNKVVSYSIISIYLFLHIRHIVNSTSINPYNSIFFQ